MNNLQNESNKNHIPVLKIISQYLYSIRVSNDTNYRIIKEYWNESKVKKTQKRSFTGSLVANRTRPLE